MRAMLTARSVAAAARQANVGQSTLRRWLREDDNFQTELRNYREEALTHASLILQQNCAKAVCLMYEFIESGAPVPHGKVTLIRTAIEFAFRSAVYCDIIDRVRALEKDQRQNSFAENNPSPKTRPSSSQEQAVPADTPPVIETKQTTSKGPRPPLSKGEQNFRRSARICSNRTTSPVRQKMAFRNRAASVRANPCLTAKIQTKQQRRGRKSTLKQAAARLQAYTGRNRGPANYSFN